MGGDTVPYPASSTDDDDVSTDRFSEIPTSCLCGLSCKKAEENESDSFRNSYEISEIKANERRMKSVYAQVYKNYDELKDRIVNMDVAKSKILSYTPGSWIENMGGITVSDYNVPKTTTLLLIGPKGSGKSSLINRISRVFEDDKFAPQRVQVTYNSSISDGTCFLQEYMIPRTSTSFCLYDTCSFSDDLSENLEMIKQWMRNGVCHGELVKSSSLQARIKFKARQDKLSSYERRRVNFVIFVVNGFSVLKCMDNNGVNKQYTTMVAKVFTSSFLSFRDHKPAIAITHGDLLSLSERACVRVYLGKLLGVHPIKQTFDIPDNCEPTTELTIVDLVRYALEHADRNIPCKSRPSFSKGSTIQLWSYLLLLLVVGMFISTVHLHPKIVPEPSPEIKKVLEVLPDIVPEPTTPEIKNVLEVFPEPTPEIKKVPEAHPEIVPKNIPEIKKINSESVPKPSLDIKKVNAERIPEKNKKMKKIRARRVPEPVLEIDWKNIRHLW